MRSVLTLPSQRKAVVDIPITKLLPQEQLQTPTNDHPCCDTKILVSGNCKRPNADLKRMVEELEEAYDKDVKELNNRVSQLEAEKAALAAQHSRETVRITEQFSAKAASYERQLEALRADSARKDGELRKLNDEKEIILRNKISQFRQQEYINKINEQEQVIRLRDLELKELLVKLEAAQLERLRLEDQALTNKLKTESEISKLTFELSETSKRYVAEQSNFSYASKLKDEASRLREEDTLKQVQELKYQLQRSQRALRQSETNTEAKSKQISIFSETQKALQQRISDLEAQNTTLKQNVGQLQKEKQELADRVLRSSEAVAFLDSEKGRLLLEIQDRLVEIDRLRVQLATKERVYEVKVERVIDGKEQIEQLQAAVFQLEQQLKLLAQDKDFLAEDLKKRQAQVDELNEGRLKLEAEITGLKAYIAKKEGSFRWAVERQIEKDIAVSGQRPQSYKVSQIGEYSRDSQQEANRVISQQIAMNMQANLFGSYPQEIILQQPIQ